MPGADLTPGAPRHSITTRPMLERQLAALHIPPGCPLMLHASLRRLGPIEGGAEALLDALLAQLGPEGTLIMLLTADDRLPFDPATTPADPQNGKLAEIFRRRSGTLVNDHPAARFGAVGRRSTEILSPAPLHDYYGAGSPLERFTALGGVVLRLGADADTVTLTHYAENLANLPTKRRVRRRYLRADSGEQWIDCIDDTDGIARWAHGDYFPRIYRDFMAGGTVRRASVGAITAELFAARDFVPFAVAWIERELR